MDTQETKVYVAALIAAGVLGVILLYFIFTVVRQHRRAQQFSREKIKAEVLTLERERKRIASDLHDDLGPLLSAIKFKINAVDLGSEEDKDLIEGASLHIDDTLAHIRSISFDLMPSALQRKGIVAAVKEFIPKIEGLTSLKVFFRHSELPVLPDEMAINLYRVILEIINNTVKHSEATQLNLELSYSDKKIILLTADNGKGFDYEDRHDSKDGLGLRNLSSRTEIMNGELLIETKHGHGVKYSLEIPFIKNT